VTPEDEVNAVEIVGELGALLQLTSNSENAASLGEAACSIKLVAGNRNQLCLQVVRPEDLTTPARAVFTFLGLCCWNR
jgi:hypothetical protein